MATIEMSTDLARMITSILSIGLGGTGSNTALTAFNNLAAGLGTATGDFNDTTYFITTNNSGATNDYYRRSYSILKSNMKTYLTPNIITSIAYNGDGNAVTALSLSTAGVLTVTTSNHVTIDTAQTITGTKSWGSNGAGGAINGAATNGGINSMRIGDDIWLGDCNAAGIMGMKSTATNCGIYTYNSSGA